MLIFPREQSWGNILTSKLISSALAGVALLAWHGVANAETPLERGTYLMQSIVACGNCHTPKGPKGEIPGMELAGMAPFEKTPGFDANAPNITPDPETGIGTWTDEQIIASIREGKRPDGSIIGPPMPIGLYRGLSDKDVEAIVAYLRNVKPVKNEIPPSVYRIPSAARLWPARCQRSRAGPQRPACLRRLSRRPSRSLRGMPLTIDPEGSRSGQQSRRGRVRVLAPGA